MRFCRRLFFIIVLAASCTLSGAQDADSLVLSQVDTDLSFQDSLSIFHLIDSLLQQGDLEASQLAVRLSYNSNVMSTGRTLGIDNFGLSPGISYYHKSGLYADLSGFWSKNFDPAYYLTVTSLGYMHDFSKRFSIIAGYDHYFYVVGKDNYVPYSNSFSVTPALELKPFVISTTYSFYFGDANAHRILPGINILLEKKKLFGLDRVTISPSFYVLFGNETITKLEFIFPRTVAEGIQNYRKYGNWIRQEETHKNVFGIMNYAVTIPLSVSHKNWLFSFSYAYNIPRALPGEPLTISESSYLSGGITRFLRLKRNKLAL
jgi:hypothetical protein